VTTGFEPDEPPPVSWVILTTWLAGLAVSIAVWALAGYALVSIIGCATGRARVYADSVVVECFAIGEDAKVIYSAPTGEAGIITSAPTKLISCEGGPLVPSILDGIGMVFKAIWTVLPWAA